MSRYLLLPLLMTGLLIAPVAAQVATDTPVVRKSAANCADMYPPEAARREQEGTTAISGVIKTDGTIGNIRISKSSGSEFLDQAAIRCVSTWRYEPAKKNGFPVEVPANPQIVWKLQGPNPTAQQKAEITALSSVLAQSPADTEALLKRARIFAQLQVYLAAISDYQRILKVKPRDVDVLIAMGRLQAIRGDAAARQSFDKAVEYSGSSIVALEARGDYFLRYEPQLARADYGAVLKLDPKRAEARFKRVMAMINLKLNDGARAELDLVIKGGNPEMYLRALALRARLSEQERNYGAAIQDYDRLAQVNATASNLNNACWVRGIANRELNIAERDCLQAIKLAPKGAYIYDSLGMIYFRTNKFHQALTMYNKAIAISPREGSSLFMRGVIKRRLGVAGADEDIAAATMVYPNVATRFSGYGILP